MCDILIEKYRPKDLSDMKMSDKLFLNEYCRRFPESKVKIEDKIHQCGNENSSIMELTNNDPKNTSDPFSNITNFKFE